MTFIIGTFQFHFKSDHKQIKWNRITWEMCKSDSLFPYWQSRSLFKCLLKFISWEGLSKKRMITVTEETCT